MKRKQYYLSMTMTIILIMDKKLPIIDGIKWYVYPTKSGIRYAQPLCLQHNMRLQPIKDYKIYDRGKYRDNWNDEAKTLSCTEDNHTIKLPRKYEDQRQHVINKVDSLNFSKMEVINLDDAAVPVAKEDLKDTDHWVRSKVTKSKSGDRLIIWAGNCSEKNKTQLFVEPSIKKLGFDQNDDHPTKVFAKVEVTFANGVKSSISKK
jgi:hypothetical protein